MTLTAQQAAQIEEIEYRCHQLYEPCDECKAKIDAIKVTP